MALNASLAGYQLINRLGEGRDGVSYQARKSTSLRQVELRVLTGLEVNEEYLEHLGRRLRQLTLLRHRAVLRVEESLLNGEAPYLALEWTGAKGLDEALANRLPYPPREALALTRELTSLLSLAHRMGLVHGHLWPGAIRLSSPKSLKVDFTGTETWQPNAACAAAWEARFPRNLRRKSAAPAADVYHTGAILFWLLTGNVPEAGAVLSAAWQERLKALSLPAQNEQRIAEGLRALLQEMLHKDILSRPSMDEVDRRVAALATLFAPGRLGGEPQDLARTAPPLPAARAPERGGAGGSPPRLPAVGRGSAPRIPTSPPPAGMAVTRPVPGGMFRAPSSPPPHPGTALREIAQQEPSPASQDSPSRALQEKASSLLERTRQNLRQHAPARSPRPSKAPEPSLILPAGGAPPADPNAVTKNTSTTPPPPSAPLPDNALTLPGAKASPTQAPPARGVTLKDADWLDENALQDTSLGNSLSDSLDRLREDSHDGDLDDLGPRTTVDIPLPSASRAPFSRDRLGPYRLLEQLGEGGLGVIFRAEDERDGSTVAVKLLQAYWANNEEILQRFQKEARLLAQVKSPYVANLLDMGEEDGVHYLVMEYVPGKNLRWVLDRQRRLPENIAIEVMSDVARALLDAHALGIVHRDIKPENILLASEDALSPSCQSSGPKVKLTDFGLARHIDQSLSLAMTQPGGPVGTPLYMSPEQCSESGQLDARSDVYAMGATFFHLVAGRPPFLAESMARLTALHCHEPPPDLQKLNPALSDGLCQVIQKCLAKAPQARYPDAGALLRDLEKLRRGEPTSIRAHPQLPEHDPQKVIQFDYTLDLESSPAELWPYFSNTERYNRAIENPAIEFTFQPDEERGTRRFGRMKIAGVEMAWEEYPYEWVNGRRIATMREYSKGPFKWMGSLTELLPRAEGGTRIFARFHVEPRGFLGKLLLKAMTSKKAIQKNNQLYQRMDAILRSRQLSQPDVDPFEPPARLPAAPLRRINAGMERLISLGADPVTVQKLGEFLSKAPVHEVARIRPFALARRLKLEPDTLLTACLHASREGLLQLLWDVLCPTCRVPAQVKDSLRQIEEHGHCDFCGVDFALDFSRSVELIFRVHPEIRDTRIGVYCIGSPARLPHVDAQIRVTAGERVEVDLDLPEGHYRLRCLSPLAFSIDLRVTPEAQSDFLEVLLDQAPPPGQVRLLKPRGQLLALENKRDVALIVRVERTAEREDALTATRASSLALFRELFPQEILTSKQLFSMATVTLLVTRLSEADRLYTELGDQRAFTLLHEHLRLVEERVNREGGALVKTTEDGVLAVFHDAASALRAGLSLPNTLGPAQRSVGLSLKIGIHRGPAMITTVNNYLDYFGLTVNQTHKLAAAAKGGEILFSEAVAQDPHVQTLLVERGLSRRLTQTDLSENALGRPFGLRLEAQPPALQSDAPNTAIAAFP